MTTSTLSLRKPVVVANWKMNGSKLKNQVLIQALKDGVKGEIQEAANTAQAQLDKIDIILCPPSAYLSQVGELIQNTIFKLGAQNVYFEKEGAYTGEISVNMLVDLGCSAVIIGHSERRHLMLEHDEPIARKFESAYHAGLVPILCVGETEVQREQGKTLTVIQSQLEPVLSLCGIKAFDSAMIAYEPVWAIGTGKAASPEDAEEVQGFIRRILAEKDPVIAEKTRILYGGSVNGNIAKALFEKPDIDGGLIGGASLIASEFLSICFAAAQSKAY